MVQINVWGMCLLRQGMRCADCVQGLCAKFKLKWGGNRARPLSSVSNSERVVDSTICYHGNDMSNVPLFWTPEHNLDCFPEVPVALQLLQHTWGRTGRTSGMAPRQRQFCCTLQFAPLVLPHRDGYIIPLINISLHRQCSAYVVPHKPQNNSWSYHKKSKRSTWGDDNYL